MKRTIAMLLVLVTLLCLLAGCHTNDGVTNTQATTEAGTDETEATPKDETPKDETPKEPIDLNGYTIVIPAGATDVCVEGISAYELKEELAGLGYTLQVKEDQESANVGENVILLGKTAATAEAVPEGSKYSITEKNGQIQILASTYYGYRGAMSFIKTKLKQENGFPRGLSYTGSSAVSNVKREADVNRVMFYNILGYDYEKPSGATGWGTPAVALRQDMQVDLLSVYAPDVVGFQEYARDYLVDFDEKLEAIGYTRVPTSKANNNSPMFYRADRVTVVESGFTDYTGESAKHNRGVTWAVFKDNETNKQFAVFNTHFLHSVDSDIAKWDTERESNAKIAVSAINAVKEKYDGISVIFGGDLNSWNVWKNYGDASTRKPYEALLNGQLTLASNVSGVETNFWTSTQKENYTQSYQGFSKFDESKKIFDPSQTTLTYANKNPYTLDHVFVGNTSSMTLHRHYIIVDELTRRASDHSPVIVDFTVK